MPDPLFVFSNHWWLYALFTVFVIAVPALDLGLFHRKAHVVGFREAAVWTAVWAAAALLFCVGLYFYTEWKFGAAAGSESAWSSSPATWWSGLSRSTTCSSSW